MANKTTLKSSFLIFLTLFSLVTLPSSTAAAALSPVASPTPSESVLTVLSFDAIYQFGDSLSDTGNLVRENPNGGALNPCGHPPYGITSKMLSGRCSDGLLMIDYIAKFFDLPLLSPYLDKGSDHSKGVNFAVAGSTALDNDRLNAMGIISPVTNSSLSVQINWFKTHLHSICGHDQSVCKEKLGKSLILLGEVGGNDYNYALLQGKTMYELIGMIPAVVDEIQNAAREVIKLGANKIVVPGNFPIGCMPIYLNMFQDNDPDAYDDLKCLQDLNNFAHYHNTLLQTAIEGLQMEYPDVAIVYGDYFSALRWLLKSASSLGFDEKGIQKACCGIEDNEYNFNMERLCGMQDVPVCANPSQRFSWDGIHLTQHAYRLLAQQLLMNVVPQLRRVA